MRIRFLKKEPADQFRCEINPFSILARQKEAASSCLKNILCFIPVHKIVYTGPSDHPLFKSMYPVGAQIIHQIDHGADPPGKRVRPVYGSDFSHEMHHRGNVGDPQHAPDGEHDDHGDKSLPRSPADGRHRVGKASRP